MRVARVVDANRLGVTFPGMCPYQVFRDVMRGVSLPDWDEPQDEATREGYRWH